jgi:amino acid transporter/mannitol/fructose-specific phosphotransferase system IIA component (Ntr-type)/nucleotide-binding universal stress UspA family protein
LKTLGRSLGLGGVVAVSIGAMIGGGLFVLPGLAAAVTGPSLWLAFLIAGLLALPAALSKAELATGMPASGGTYLFIERSLGPLAGTVAGIGAALSLVFKACFALIGLSWYLAVLIRVPDTDSPQLLRGTGLALLLLLAILNGFGVARVGRIQKLLVNLSLSLLALMVAGGMPSIRAANLEPMLPNGLGGLLAASAFVFVSYAGVTKIAAIAEEVRQPERNIPLGILLSLAIMAILYAVCSAVMLGVVHWQELDGDVTPLATLASRLAGEPLTSVAAVVAMLALTSVANSGILTASRFPFAMARDGLLPSFLAHVHPRLLTPIPAIAAIASLMAATILLLDVVKVVKLASGFQIFIFAAENFALIVFRESGVRWYRPSFRSPLYPWVQIGGVLGGMVLLVMLGPVAWLGVAGFSSLAVAWFLAWGRRHAGRTGLLQQVLRARPEAASPAGQPAPAVAGLPDMPAARSASVVVALFGQERSPETLLEIANVLRRSPGDGVDVLLFEEVPEQTVLADAPADDRAASFHRRVSARAEELQVTCRFDEVVSHDLRPSLFERVSASSCSWVLMAHRARRRYASIVRSPHERLVVRLPCDVALFRDAGIRTYRKILVFAEPGPHDALVVRTARELARVFGANVSFVGVIPESAQAAGERAASDYLAELVRMCPGGAESQLIRGDDRVSTIVHASVEHDLLLLAADSDHALARTFFPSESDRIAARAVSSVLLLRTPRHRTHDEVESLAASRGSRVDLLQVLVPSATRARLGVRDKRELFSALSDAFAQPLGLDPEEVEQAFWSRERLQNTAIGHSVAIPHATLSEARRTMVGVFTMRSEIDYHAGGNEGVRFCFAAVGPPSERQSHLELLARISSLLLKTSLLEDLRAASHPEDLRAAIARAQGEFDGGSPH